jgi:hypothetical protein
VFVRLPARLYLLWVAGRLHHDGLKWIIYWLFDYIQCHDVEVLDLQHRTDAACINVSRPVIACACASNSFTTEIVGIYCYMFWLAWSSASNENKSA